MDDRSLFNCVVAILKTLYKTCETHMVLQLKKRQEEEEETNQEPDFEMPEHSGLSWKGVEMLWLTSQMSPPDPPWNSKRTAELMEARMCEEMRKAFAYLLLAEWLCAARSLSRSLSRCSLFFLY